MLMYALKELNAYALKKISYKDISHGAYVSPLGPVALSICMMQILHMRLDAQLSKTSRRPYIILRTVRK